MVHVSIFKISMKNSSQSHYLFKEKSSSDKKHHYEGNEYLDINLFGTYEGFICSSCYEDLEEDLEEYFDINQKSPYMLLVSPVKDHHRYPEPDNYQALPMKERLYHLRSDIPAGSLGTGYEAAWHRFVAPPFSARAIS